MRSRGGETAFEGVRHERTGDPARRGEQELHLTRPGGVDRQHDAKRPDDGARSVPDRNGDRKGLSVHMPAEQRIAVVADALELGTQIVWGRHHRRPVRRGIDGEHSFLSRAIAVREEYETARGVRQRHPSGEVRVRHRRSTGGQAFDKEHVVAVEHTEMDVVADDRMHVLHERQRGVAQRQRRRRAGGELPHAHPDADLAVRSSCQETVIDELIDEARDRRDVQPRARGDVGDPHGGLVRSEHLEDLDDPRQERSSRTTVPHPGSVAHPHIAWDRPLGAPLGGEHDRGTPGGVRVGRVSGEGQPGIVSSRILIEVEENDDRVHPS